MPSRKAAAVSSSQWTESFEATACACARGEVIEVRERKNASRTARIVERVRVVMSNQNSQAANSSTREFCVENAFVAGPNKLGGRGRPPHGSDFVISGRFPATVPS